MPWEHEMLLVRKTPCSLVIFIQDSIDTAYACRKKLAHLEHMCGWSLNCHDLAFLMLAALLLLGTMIPTHAGNAYTSSVDALALKCVCVPSYCFWRLRLTDEHPNAMCALLSTR